MSNRFRPEHRQLTPFEGALVDDIKTKAEELAKLFDMVSGREGALANTHLEIAVLVGVKGATR